MKPQIVLGFVVLCAAPLAPMLTNYARANPAKVALHTPKPGSRERAAIMDALRVPVQKYHKGVRPTFTNVFDFRVGGGWAFLGATTVDGKGKSLGMFDDADITDSIYALLHLEKGKWRVMEWGYFTDVGWFPWAVEHPNVPLNVLGMKPSDMAEAKQDYETEKQEEREEKRKAGKK